MRCQIFGHQPQFAAKIVIYFTVIQATRHRLRNLAVVIYKAQFTCERKTLNILEHGLRQFSLKFHKISETFEAEIFNIQLQCSKPEDAQWHLERATRQSVGVRGQPMIVPQAG